MGKMKPITVYCAHCLKPLANQLSPVKVPTETCIRSAVAEWRTDRRCWYLNPDKIQCVPWTAMP